MNENRKKDTLHADWVDFQARTRAPASLREPIFASVYADLEPSSSRVLAKLGVVHVVTSLVTLSICPQFGVRAFGEGMGIMQAFMGLGDWGCPLACGIFFLGMSLLVASVLFSRAEWKKLRSQRWLAISALVLPSIGFFKIMDGEFFLGFSIAWVLGAFIGGVLLVEGIWRLKSVPVTA